MKELEYAVSLWIEKTKEFLAVPSVVGFEHPFMDKLQQEFESLGLQVNRHDRYLHVHGSEPEGLTLSAHIDRHGLVSNGSGELEYAAYRVKEMKYDEVKEIMKGLWEKIKERFIDEKVYAYDPEKGFKICEGTIHHCYLCPNRDNFVFQVQTFQELPANIPVSFSPDTKLENKLFSGQLDNAISVACGYLLFKLGFQGNLVLTTEEEIGKSWEYLLEVLKSKGPTHELLVLDTSPFDHDKYANVNMDSVILRKQDASGEFNAKLAEKAAILAVEKNIPTLFKDAWILHNSSDGKPHLGKTELGRLATESKGKYNGITLQIPTINYHTNNESATTSAMHNFLMLTQLLLQIKS